MLTRGRSLAAPVVVLIATAVIGSAPLRGQSRAPSGPRIPDVVRAHARGHGSVRVIVGLNVAYASESLLGVSAVQSQRASIARAQGAVLRSMLRTRPGSVRRFSSIPYLALEVDETDLQTLAASGDVTDIQIDAVAAPTLAESTPLIGATKAWAAGYTGAGWTVAIIDTGVDSSHPFLAGKVVSEACFSSTVTGRSSSMCPSFTDTSTLPGSGGPCLLAGCEHGTHVAGIAAGKGTAFSGVAPDATLISIQVFSSFDSDDCAANGLPTPCLLSYTSDQILGLERVYSLRSSYNIAAANLSLGGGLATSPCDTNSMKTVIDQLRLAGIATVIAAGNDGSSTALSYPACISSAISVASTTDGSYHPVDQVSTFSNTNQYLSLLAPGQTIYSSVPSGFMNLSGTSMAAPHVAGAWALIKSKRSTASVDEILSALQQTGTSITDPRSGLVFPRINVDLALATFRASCEYSVNPSQVTLGPQAGTVTLTVTAPVNCAWSATSGSSSFVAVPGSQAHVGSGSVVLSYSANSSLSSRSSTLTIANTTVIITQRGLRPVQGDINGDGRADIVLQNLADGSLTTWWLDGSSVIGNYPLGINQVSDTNWRVVGAGDVDGDGNTDLVWRHRTTGALAVWTLMGTNVLNTQFLSIDHVSDLNWEIKGVGDIDGDGKADLIWQNRLDGRLAAWLMDGARVIDTRFLSIGQVPDLDWEIAGVGDVDGDGYADLLWQHQTGGWLAVWGMQGTNVIRTQLLDVTRTADTNWHIRGVGDVDGDNHADIIWQNDATGELGVWTLNGTAVMTQRLLSTSSALTVNWRVVGPG